MISLRKYKLNVHVLVLNSNKSMHANCTDWGQVWDTVRKKITPDGKYCDLNLANGWINSLNIHFSFTILFLAVNKLRLPKMGKKCCRDFCHFFEKGRIFTQLHDNIAQNDTHKLRCALILLNLLSNSTF